MKKDMEKSITEHPSHHPSDVSAHNQVLEWAGNTQTKGITKEVYICTYPISIISISDYAMRPKYR